MPRPQRERTERKRAKSQKHRLYWRPGEPHALDSLEEEVQALEQELPEQLARLLAQAQQTQHCLSTLLASEEAQADQTGPFKAADQHAMQAITQRFSTRKHHQHLQWFFALMRRKRLLGRLRAIEAVLELATGLLAEEDTLSQAFLSALQADQRTDPIGSKKPIHHPEAPEPPPLTKAEARLQGIKEPLMPLLSSAEHSRHMLTQFETRLPELRRHLSLSNGWFEVFFVPKKHVKPTLRAYAQALEQKHTLGKPLPEEIAQALHPEVARLLRQAILPQDMPRNLRDEIYDITPLGPYVRYRWREDGHLSTISLGLLDDYPPYPFVPHGF